MAPDQGSAFSRGVSLFILLSGHLFSFFLTSPISWGFTRCGADGTFFAMQRREDGMWCMTDGADANVGIYLQYLMDMTEVVRVSTPPVAEQMPAARAVSCIADIGMVAVVDELGVVFVPMFKESKPDVVYRSNIIESTLAMAGPIAIFVEKDVVVGVDVRHGNVKMTVPIFNMSTSEMVWNISVSGNFPWKRVVPACFFTCPADIKYLNPDMMQAPY